MVKYCVSITDIVTSPNCHLAHRLLLACKGWAEMADSLNLNGKIALRRAITTSAFTMIALVVVIGLFSLFSIWLIRFRMF